MRERKQVERHDPSAWSRRTTSATSAATLESEARVKQARSCAKQERERLDREAAATISLVRGDEVLEGSGLTRDRRFTFLLVLRRKQVDLPIEVLKKIFAPMSYHLVWRIESVSLVTGRVAMSALNFGMSHLPLGYVAAMKSKGAAEVAARLRIGELWRVDADRLTPTKITLSHRHAFTNRTLNNSDADVHAALAPWRTARASMPSASSGTLGSFTPPKVSLAMIMKAAHALATAAQPHEPFSDAADPFWDSRVDGFTSALPHRVAFSWTAYVRPEPRAEQPPGAILNAYVRACELGRPSYHLELSSVFAAVDQGPCLGGDNLVRMADGSHKRVAHITVGDALATAAAGGGGAGHSAVVRAVWRATVERAVPMCVVGGVELTPDHPIHVAGSWCLPPTLTPPRARHVDAVYNLLLATPAPVLLCDGGDAAHDRGDATHGDGDAAHGGGAAYVVCSTLAQHVPGFEEPLWGSDQIADVMRQLPGFPNVVTAC